MARRKLRAKNQAGTAVTAPAAPDGASIASQAASAAASDADARWMELSGTFSHLLSCPDSSLVQGTGILDACKALDQLFAQPSPACSASADQQVNHLAAKALHQLKLPHLVAKLLACGSTQPADGQLSSSKWQQPGYCRNVSALLESHVAVYG